MGHIIMEIGPMTCTRITALFLSLALASTSAAEEGSEAATPPPRKVDRHLPAPVPPPPPFLYEARVASPVVDLRREPSDPGSDRSHDPLEESQLLYGEPVRVLEEKGAWARVEVTEQMEWTHHQRWEGYPGWIRKSDLVRASSDWSPNLMITSKQIQVLNAPRSDAKAMMTLSIGSRLKGVRSRPRWWELKLLDSSTGWITTERAEELPIRYASYPLLRRNLIETARLFLGDLYYWGGRSAFLPGSAAPPHTGTDCSGLVGLAYQLCGVTIPRDAHEQWLKARKINRDHLKPGDLIFLFDEKEAQRISHVMLYAGDSRVIEGPGTGERVREILLEDRLRGIPPRRVACGSLLD